MPANWYDQQGLRNVAELLLRRYGRHITCAICLEVHPTRNAFSLDQSGKRAGGNLKRRNFRCRNSVKQKELTDSSCPALSCGRFIQRALRTLGSERVEWARTQILRRREGQDHLSCTKISKPFRREETPPSSTNEDDIGDNITVANPNDNVTKAKDTGVGSSSRATLADSDPTRSGQAIATSNQSDDCYVPEKHQAAIRQLSPAVVPTPTRKICQPAFSQSRIDKHAMRASSERQIINKRWATWCNAQRREIEALAEEHSARCLGIVQGLKDWEARLLVEEQGLLERTIPDSQEEQGEVELAYSPKQEIPVCADTPTPSTSLSGNGVIPTCESAPPSPSSPPKLSAHLAKAKTIFKRYH
jgi:hypothetical protein